jgi:hypothetical protein
LGLWIMDRFNHDVYGVSIAPPFSIVHPFACSGWQSADLLVRCLSVNAAML